MHFQTQIWVKNIYCFHKQIRYFLLDGHSWEEKCEGEKSFKGWNLNSDRADHTSSETVSADEGKAENNKGSGYETYIFQFNYYSKALKKYV